MKQTIIIFGSLSVIMMLLFQLEHWSLYALGGSERTYLIVSGVIFLILGILFSRYFFLRTEQRTKQKYQQILSKQELTVLQMVADGLSNKDIAEKLFIAETTVKSHVSNILSKLDARRRTEAVRIAREMNIL